MGYVRNLSIPFLYKLVMKASEKEVEAQEFKMYCAVLPYLEKPMSFNEWLQESKKQTSNNEQRFSTTKSNDEIMQEIGGGIYGTI